MAKDKNEDKKISHTAEENVFGTTTGKTCKSLALSWEDTLSSSPIQQSLFGTDSRGSAHMYLETYTRYS